MLYCKVASLFNKLTNLLAYLFSLSMHARRKFDLHARGQKLANSVAFSTQPPLSRAHHNTGNDTNRRNRGHSRPAASIYSSTRLIPLPVGNFKFRFQFFKLTSNCWNFMQTWLLHFQVATCVLRVLRLNSLDIALQPIPRYIVSSLTVMTAVMTCESIVYSRSHAACIKHFRY